MIFQKIKTIQWSRKALFLICFLSFSSTTSANVFSTIARKFLNRDHKGDYVDHFVESGDFEEYLNRWRKENPGYDLSGHAGPMELLAESDPHVLVKKHLPSVKKATHDEITGVLEVHGVSLESGSREEVFEKFRDLFTRKKGIMEPLRRDRRIRNGYKGKVFGLWWLDPDFRKVIFESMTEEHIDNVYDFFKWWDEAKATGMESRLKDFTESSLRKVGFSLDEFMGLLRPSDEGQHYLDPRMLSHPFLRTTFEATNENDNLVDEWLEILSRPNAVGKDIT